jgi:uncharacterized membrane protein YbaN (DUF454 family)
MKLHYKGLEFIMRKRIKKYILTSIGLLSVLLGVIGAVLPILPTTPFLILALACFAKSSPRFHAILLNNPWFGAALQQWEASRTITRAIKIKAMLLVVLTFSVSIGVLFGRLYLQLGLLLLACVLLVFMWRLKEADVVEVPVFDK